MQVHVAPDRLDAPGGVGGADQEVELVSVMQQAPGKVGADEPRAARHEDTLHPLEEALVVEDLQVLPCTGTDLRALAFGERLGGNPVAL